MSCAAPFSPLSARLIVAVLLASATAAGCVTRLPPVAQDVALDKPVVLGRAVSVLLGPTSRWYLPSVRFVELVNRETRQRYQVLLEAEDRRFAIEVPAGKYELSRVQISEGPFMSMADMRAAFTVTDNGLVSVGTWRFGVEIPQYGRKVVVSIIEDAENARESVQRFMEEHPEWVDQSLTTSLPEPTTIQARLYEVAPYPRNPRYFRRHWW